MNIKVLWEVALLFISFLLAWCNIRIDKAENLSINSNTVLEQISLNEFLTTEDFWEEYKQFREVYLRERKKTIFSWDDLDKYIPETDTLMKIVPTEESILKEFFGDISPVLEDFTWKFVQESKVIGHKESDKWFFKEDIISTKQIDLWEYEQYRAKILYEWALSPYHGNDEDKIWMIVPTEEKIKQSYINSFFIWYNEPLR